MAHCQPEPTMTDPQQAQPYWAKSTEELFSEYGATANGLSQREAARRLAVVGDNRLVEHRETGVAALLLRQYQSPLVLILVFGACVSLALGQWTDAAIILAIVLGSTLLGFAQEYRASEALKELRSRLALRVKVLRDGVLRTIEASEVVPGDVLALSAGNLVPADGVVLDGRDFLVSQAALTGESFPVEKSVCRCSPTAPVAHASTPCFWARRCAAGPRACW